MRRHLKARTHTAVSGAIGLVVLLGGGLIVSGTGTSSREPDLAILERPASPQDRLPDEYLKAVSSDVGDGTRVRFARADGTLRTYVAEGRPGQVCIILVRGSGQATRIVTTCEARSSLAAQPFTVTLDDGTGGADVVILAPTNGVTAAHVRGSVFAARNNAVVVPGVKDTDGTILLTSPAGNVTVEATELTPKPNPSETGNG